MNSSGEIGKYKVFRVVEDSLGQKEQATAIMSLVCFLPSTNIPVALNPKIVLLNFKTLSVIEDVL